MPDPHRRDLDPALLELPRARKQAPEPSHCDLAKPGWAGSGVVTERSPPVSPTRLSQGGREEVGLCVPPRWCGTNDILALCQNV